MGQQRISQIATFQLPCVGTRGRLGVMSHRVTAMLALLLAASPPALARADKVHLTGGAVLEGRVSRTGDKILVEVESGTLSVEAGSVVRIEQGPSALDTFLERRAALTKGDVAGRLALADYCHEHEMLSRERELLREVIALQPDHAQARSRLGYVRGAHGWLTRDEHMAAQGLVKHGGVWVSQEQALRLREAELERQKAELERQKAETELLTKRAELNTERERAERERAEREAAERASQNAYWFPYAYPMRPVHPIQPPMHSAPVPPYAINGVRPPQSYFP
jgi:hypothetical protein